MATQNITQASADLNTSDVNIDDETIQNVNDDDDDDGPGGPDVDSIAEETDDDDDIELGDDDDDDDIDMDEDDDIDDESIGQNTQPSQKISGDVGVGGPSSSLNFPLTDGVDLDDDKISEGLDDIEYDEDALKKINNERDSMHIVHPEQETVSLEELSILTTVTRNKNGIIVDALHKTIPRLTKYEKTRIIGTRIKQLNSGSAPYIVTDGKVIDKSIIAEKELKEKKIPFIIKRPLPNGGSEYWKLDDLEVY